MTSLGSLNTFGIECDTQELIEVTELDQLTSISKTHKRDSLFILGGGSNLLLVDSAPAVILHMANTGIHYQRGDESTLVTVMSGVVWHELVIDTLAQGLSGLENLALIPGLTGAAPIQNIGAYGVELEQRFVSLTAVNLSTGEVREFDHAACDFAYRDSYFKTAEGRDWCIWDVTLSLDNAFNPVLMHQGLVHLQDRKELTARQVFDEVVSIRRSKLPDPVDLGNAGSFFKNPVINKAHYLKLKAKYADIVAYSMPDDQWKLPAAWLIDRAGLKGYRDGEVGTHIRQALVLVNYGGATGKQLINLAKYIQSTVLDEFEILLEPEVNIVNENGLIPLGDL